MSRLHSRSIALFASMLFLSGVGVAGIAPEAYAATRTVTNCNDSGAGSLRATVAAAASEDVIDMRGLSCGAIRTSSAIAIPQASLTLQGPGYHRLAIDINWTDSVLRHTGTGTLRLRGVSIVHGTRQAQRAEGGCVYSTGNVDAYDVSIAHCGAHGLGVGVPTSGWGGGIFAQGSVTLRYSSVRNSAARGAQSAGGAIWSDDKVTLLRARIVSANAAEAGGVRALEGVDADTTTFSNNLAGRGDGGAIFTAGPIRIVNSTIHSNNARMGGGIYAPGDSPITIVNTTISSNSARIGSAAYVSGDVTVANSTISNHFDSATDATGMVCEAGAFTVVGGALHLESTIAAYSQCLTSGRPTPLPDIWFLGEAIGNDNIVGFWVGTLPPDTITDAPSLLPLANYGGRTLTHALSSVSNAIDAGNNSLGLANDQRGPGFPRVRNGRADVGAFEFQPE